jgi:hypothetical protein
MKHRAFRILCVCTFAALIASSSGWVSSQTVSPLDDQLGQLKSTSAASGDTTLKSLGNDLASNASALNKSPGNNPENQNQTNPKET